MGAEAKERRDERGGRMRGRREKCHGVLVNRCEAMQKTTGEAPRRQETRHERVKTEEREGNWGDERRPGGKEWGMRGAGR